MPKLERNIILKAFARNIDLFLRRYRSKMKKMGVHRLRFGENMHRRSPQIWKNRTSLANKAIICKPKTIAIESVFEVKCSLPNID